MIKLNRLTDYAVVVLSQMGSGGHTVLTATQMAQDSGVPLPTVAKLMKQLSRAEIVTSQRGAGGGYVLARAPEDITVAEIITALEGPIALTACVDGAESHCEVETLCPMRGNWNRVNEAIYQALSDVMLADMAMPALPFAAVTRKPAAVAQ